MTLTTDGWVPMTSNTFPDWLKFQAVSRSNCVALRYKALGLWHEKTWSALQQDVLSSVALLKQYGFCRGSTLFCLTHPRFEALVLSMAAHWLGGVCALLDPDQPEPELVDLVTRLKPVYVFAEGQKQVDLLDKVEFTRKLVVYADQRGLLGHVNPALVSYPGAGEVTAAEQHRPVIAVPENTAFLIYRLDNAKNVLVQELFHNQMLHQGEDLVRNEGLGEAEEALVARGFAASGHIQYMLAPWLIAGFRLNFPENLETRDQDRREIGPTLVAGTSKTYQRVQAQIESRLPLAGTLLRKWVERVLTSDRPSSFLIKVMDYWFVIRPLRDVIGFSRLRTPLLVGEPLPESSVRFFQAIGVNVRNWPEQVAWQKPDDTPRKFKPLIDSGSDVADLIRIEV